MNVMIFLQFRTRLHTYRQVLSDWDLICVEQQTISIPIKLRQKRAKISYSCIYTKKRDDTRGICVKPEQIHTCQIILQHSDGFRRKRSGLCIIQQVCTLCDGHVAVTGFVLEQIRMTNNWQLIISEANSYIFTIQYSSKFSIFPLTPSLMLCHPCGTSLSHLKHTFLKLLRNIENKLCENASLSSDICSGDTHKMYLPNTMKEKRYLLNAKCCLTF